MGLGVRMPPSYIVRSNEQRTTFRPNLNEITSGLCDDDAGVYVAEIPSRDSLVDNRTAGDVSRHYALPCSAQHLDAGSLQLEPARSLDNHGPEARMSRDAQRQS